MIAWWSENFYKLATCALMIAVMIAYVKMYLMNGEIYDLKQDLKKAGIKVTNDE